MFCSNCGTECSTDANFCGGCGDALAKVCAACDRPLSATANFCEGCGTPVADSPGASTEAPATSPPASMPDSGAVRKTVTVLFCDLVGSTSFGESVDAESAREAMGRYFTMAKTAIEEHGGTVAKFIGDGAMAMFGIPEVAEDDAHRAIAAGLKLQQRFVAIQEHIAGRYNVEVGLRVGINTGEVVIADDDADIVGDALNTAARLEAACTPGRVLVGEDTWRLTRSTVKYEVLGEVMVKGKAEPIATFEVVEESGSEDEASTPFVGRDDELAVLREVYDRAVASSTAHLVTVVGSPGVGKTRLAHELVRSIDGVQSLDLRCERAGTATFAPIADLLRSVAGLGVEQSGEEVAESLSVWLAGAAADADRLLPLLSSFLGVGATHSTEELFFAARRLIEILAGDAPLVVVVDDIQWAESLFLDLVEHLVEWVTEAKVLLVALARPEIREVRPSLAEPGRRVEHVVSLEGLDAAATAQLAAELLGADRVPADLLARLPESTEGNPLFVRELMRMLVDDGVIANAGSGWELTIDAEAVEVPPTIQSLLSTRVERMAPDERRLVELAAVVGADFPRGAVAAIADGLSDAQIDSGFQRLRRTELIEPTGAYWGNEPVYRFHHVLVRDAAYRRLLKGKRAELHLRVGDWTEQTANALTGEHEVAIAFHFEQAQRYRRELGLDDDETTNAGRKAAALLRRAAERALERDDLAAAGSLAVRALDCLGDDPGETAELLVLANEALLSAGDVAQGAPLLARLEQIAATDDRLAQWATCFRGQLAVLTDPGALGSASAEVDAAADRLAELDDQAGVAKARLVRAGVLARLGRVGDCEAELDRALTAARAADDRRRVTAVLGAAPTAALWGPSPVPRAGGRCLDVIRLLRITTGSPAVEATSVRCQAVLEALRGRFDTARSMLATARATAEEVGLRHGLYETEFYAGLVELLAGEPVAAEPHLRTAYDGLGRLGVGADAGQAAAHLARSLLLQGRLEEADEIAAASDALAGQNPQTGIAARSVQAEVLAAQGQFGEAAQLAEEAVAIAAATDILVDHANALTALARVRAAAGQTAEAQVSAAAAQALFDQKAATVRVELDGLSVPLSSGPDDVEPSPADEPLLDSSVLRNACTEVLQRSVEYYEGSDWAAVAALVADDMHTESRRSGPTLGRVQTAVEVVQQLERSFETGYTRMEREDVAIRGERFSLSTLRVQTESGAETAQLAVCEIDESGRWSRTVSFDDDDLVAALVELDRLYFDTIDRDDHAAYAQVVDNLVSRKKDESDFRSFFRPDCVFVEHRLPSLDHLSRVDLPAEFGIADYEALWETSPMKAGSIYSIGGVGFVRQIQRSEPTLALVDIQVDAGDYRERTLGIAEVRDGLMARWETFDPNDLDLALARFDELKQGHASTDVLGDTAGAPSTLDEASEGHPALPPLENDATRTMEQTIDALRRRSMQEASALIADEFWREDRRSGISAPPLSGPEAMIDNMWALAELGLLDSFRAVPMATRGDSFALYSVVISNSEGAELAMLQLGRVEATRTMVSIVFDPDDVAAAHAELDRLFVASLPEDHREPFGHVSRHLDASNRGGIDDVSPTLPARGTIIDHGQVGRPNLDRDEHRNPSRLSTDVEGTSFIEQVYAVAPGRVFYGTKTRFAGSGAVVHRITVAHTNSAGDGLIAEYYDEDQFADALERFDELAEASTPLWAVVENECTRSLAPVSAHFAARDWSSLAGRIAPDVAYTQRQTGPHSSDIHGRDHLVAEGQEMAKLGFNQLTREPLAVRGQRHALTLVSYRTSASDEKSALSVEEIDGDGLLITSSTFDIGDLAAAQVELDRLYIESLPADSELIPVLEAAQRSTAAAGARDSDMWDAVTSEDLVAIDHRAGIGDTYGKALWLENAAVMGEVASSGVFLNRQIHRLSAAGMAVSGEVRTTDAQGASLVWPTAVLSLYQDGLVSRIEMFDPESMHEMVARFDELTGGTSRLPTTPSSIENECSRVAAKMLDLWRAGDWEQMAEGLAPDGARHDRRRFVALPAVHGRAGIVESLRQGVEAGFTDITDEPVAVRGDRFVLLELAMYADQEVGHRLLVVGINPPGLVESTTYFDIEDLPAAIAELDRLYLEDLDPIRADLYQRLLDFDHAVMHGDAEAAVEPFLPDFDMVDHRSLGWGPQSTIQDRVSSLIASADTVLLFTTQIHLFEPLLFCGSRQYRVVTADGAELTQDLVIVNEHDPATGKVCRIDQYGDDQLEDAIAYAHERSAALALASNPPDPTPDPSKMENAATRTSDHISHLVRNGLVEELADIIHPDAVTADHARLGSGVGNREDFIGAMKSWRQVWAEGDPDLGGPVAVRGGHLALMEYRFGTQGGWSVERLGGVEVDGGGLLTYLNFYDPVDEVTALEELETRWEAAVDGEVGPAASDQNDPTPGGTLSVLDNACSRLQRRIPNLVTESFADELREIVADDAVVDDMRSGLKLSGTVRSGGELVDGTLRSTDPDVGYSEIDLDIVAIRGDRVSLISFVLRTADGLVNERLAVDVMNPDGRIGRSSFFDPDDVVGALEELEALYIADEGAPFHVVLETFATTMSALNRSDPESVIATYHPDFQLVDHRALGWGTLDHAAMSTRARSSMQMFPTSTLIGRQLHGVAPCVICAEVSVARESEDGGGQTETGYVFVLQVDHEGMQTHIDQYDLDQLPDALAKFAEVEAGGPGLAAGHTEPESADDAVVQPSAQQPTTLPPAPQTSIREPLVAALAEGSPTNRADRFDPLDDVVSASEPAHARPEPAGDPAVPQPKQPTAPSSGLEHAIENWRYATDARDWGALSTALAADFVFADRRDTVVDVLDHAEYLDRERSRARGIDRLVTRVTDTHESSGDAALIGISCVAGQGAGVEVAWDVLAVVAGDQGALALLEYFAPDDVEAARARFTELSRPSGLSDA